MALTSASTFTDAYAQLNDNLDWAGVPAKARVWLEAAMWMQGNRPTFSMRQNAQVNFINLEKTMDVARDLVAADPTSQANRAPFVKGKARYGA